jgi:hypothetical protein
MHALGFSVFTSGLLAKDLNTETSTSNHLKSSRYFVFSHSVLLCPNLYSVSLHNSLRTCFILVLVPSTAEPSWTTLAASELVYIATARTTQKTQFYCCVARTTQETNHMIAISPVYWRADCCLATSYKHSSYCCLRVSLGVYRAVAWQCVDMSQLITLAN